MNRLVKEKIPIDTLTLNNQLKSTNDLKACGDIPYLAFLSKSVPTAANAMTYAKVIKTDSNRRKLLSIAKSLEAEAWNGDPDELIDDTVKLLNGIQMTETNKPYVHVAELVKPVSDDMINNEVKKRGIPSYLTKLDGYVGCMENGDLIVIAGRPGMGKTAMALSMGYQQAKNGYRVGIVTMDMTKERLTRRLLCHEFDADLSEYITGIGGDPRKIVQGAGVLYDLPIYIADAGKLTVPDLERRIKLMVRKEGVDIIYVDYLQQIKARGGNREQQVAEASRTLKALAKDLNVPIIALAQLNRALELRDDKEPRLSDLRESGQIEQDAEIIMFPYRDEVYNEDSKYKGQVKIILGKTRDSGAVRGFVVTAFIAKSMRFTDL
jgi:replicative DNA helicase